MLVKTGWGFIWSGQFCGANENHSPCLTDTALFNPNRSTSNLLLCNRLPPEHSSLKQTDTYSLTVSVGQKSVCFSVGPQAQGLTELPSRCQRGLSRSEGSNGGRSAPSSPSGCWPTLALSGCWLNTAVSCLSPGSSPHAEASLGEPPGSVRKMEVKVFCSPILKVSCILVLRREFAFPLRMCMPGGRDYRAISAACKQPIRVVSD